MNRSVPVGPQEAVDCLEALDSVTNRIESIERSIRLHARPFAAEDETLRTHRRVLTKTNQDTVNYKNYVESVFKHTARTINERVGAIETIIQTTVNENLNMLGEKAATSDSGFASLLAFVNSALGSGPIGGRAETQQFDIM